MAPRGFGTMFSMLLLGTSRAAGSISRVLIGDRILPGVVCDVGDVGARPPIRHLAIIWPTIMQGVGTGLVFPGLSAAALASMHRQKMRRAASLYSVTRNLGAAVGTSYLTTLLIRRQQVNQSHLTERVSAFTSIEDAGARRNEHGADQMLSGHREGLAMLYGMVQRQAMMLSFNDIYRMLAVLMLLWYRLSCSWSATAATSPRTQSSSRSRPSPRRHNRGDRQPRLHCHTDVGQVRTGWPARPAGAGYAHFPQAKQIRISLKIKDLVGLFLHFRIDAKGRKNYDGAPSKGRRLHFMM